jgi:hypothetical protein
MQDFSANYKGRVCNKCFESPAEPITDLVKHVQKLYEKKKPVNPDGK